MISIALPKEVMPLLQKEMVSVMARGSRYTRISPAIHIGAATRRLLSQMSTPTFLSHNVD
jgi:hypothetical protein